MGKGRADERWDLDSSSSINEKCSVSKSVQGNRKQLVVKERIALLSGGLVKVSILLSVAAGTRWPRSWVPSKLESAIYSHKDLVYSHPLIIATEVLVEFLTKDLVAQPLYKC